MGRGFRETAAGWDGSVKPVRLSVNLALGWRLRPHFGEMREGDIGPLLSHGSISNSCAAPHQIRVVKQKLKDRTAKGCRLAFRAMFRVPWSSRLCNDMPGVSMTPS